MTDHEIVNAFLELLRRQGFRVIPPKFGEPVATTTHQPGETTAHVHFDIPVLAPPQIVAAPGAAPSLLDLSPLLQAVEAHRAALDWPAA